MNATPDPFDWRLCDELTVIQAALEFGALTLPNPSFAEQHHVVAEVDALMALCYRIEANLTATPSPAARCPTGRGAAPRANSDLEAVE